MDGNDTDDSDSNLVIDEEEALSPKRKSPRLSKRLTRSVVTTKNDEPEELVTKVETKVSKPIKKRPVQASSTASGKASNSFLGSLVASQESFLQPKPVQSIGDQEENKMQRYEGDFVQVAKHGNALKDYVAPQAGKNVHFRRWFIRSKEKPSEKLHLLVKGSTHGLRDYDLLPFTVSSKMEGQLPFGLEQISKKELAHDWLATMLRPNSWLARVRTNIQDQNVLQVDLKSLKDLTQDGLEIAGESFNPAHSLGQ